MVANSEIMQSIFSVMEMMNKSLPADSRLNCDADFILFGSSSRFDSLGLANFIVNLEEKIEEQFHCSLGFTEGDFSEFFNADPVSVQDFTQRISHLIDKKQRYE